MNWWKIAIIASVAWVLFVCVLLGVSLWYVSHHPFAPNMDQARAAKVAKVFETLAPQVAGFLWGGGVTGIWIFLYLRHKNAKASAADTSQGPLVTFAPCPVCASLNAIKINYTWWGGLLGPSMFHHVKCSDCHTTFNGKTGKSNALPITIYVLVSMAVGVALVVILWKLVFA